MTDKRIKAMGIGSKVRGSTVRFPHVPTSKVVSKLVTHMQLPGTEGPQQRLLIGNLQRGKIGGKGGGVIY